MVRVGGSFLHVIRCSVVAAVHIQKVFLKESTSEDSRVRVRVRVTIRARVTAMARSRLRARELSTAIMSVCLGLGSLVIEIGSVVVSEGRVDYGGVT